MLAPSGGGLIIYQAYDNLYAMTGRKAHLLEDKQISSVGVFDEVFLALGWHLEILKDVPNGSSTFQPDSECSKYHSAYFQSNPDCTGREGISPLIKCTSAIRRLTYGVNADFLDEYMQISERTSHTALDHSCQAVMEIYGPGYLRKPTVTDIEKLYRHHEEKHGFSGMLGSLDCTNWEWFGCPYDFKGQY
ncbi:hypothetical protein Tco_0617169, partial [Tanacetum coccineum]